MAQPDPLFESWFPDEPTTPDSQPAQPAPDESAPGDGSECWLFDESVGAGEEPSAQSAREQCVEPKPSVRPTSQGEMDSLPCEQQQIQAETCGSDQSGPGESVPSEDRSGPDWVGDSWLDSFDGEATLPAAASPGIQAMVGSWTCTESKSSVIHAGWIKQLCGASIGGLLLIAAYQIWLGSGDTTSSVGPDPLSLSHSHIQGVLLEGPDHPVPPTQRKMRVLSPIQRDGSVPQAPAPSFARPRTQRSAPRSAAFNPTEPLPASLSASFVIVPGGAAGVTEPKQHPESSAKTAVHALAVPEISVGTGHRTKQAPIDKEHALRVLECFDALLAYSEPLLERSAPVPPLATTPEESVAAQRGLILFLEEAASAYSAARVLECFDVLLAYSEPVLERPAPELPLPTTPENLVVGQGGLNLSLEEAASAFFAVWGTGSEVRSLLWSPSIAAVCPDESPLEQLQRLGRWDDSLVEEQVELPAGPTQVLSASVAPDPGPMTHTLELVSDPEPRPARSKGTLRRAEQGARWLGSEPVMELLDHQDRLSTPLVGAVRIRMLGGELFEGRLLALGQGRAWIETELGAMSLEGRRIGAMEKLDPSQLGVQGTKSRVHNYTGRKRVRVQAPGGAFVGHLLARDEDSLTLWVDEGFKITLYGTQEVEDLQGARTTLRRQEKKE